MAEHFLDFLTEEQYLPSFNLPTDSVSFIARTANYGEEDIEVRMSNGLESALTQYAPGKEIFVRKKKYISHGLFMAYPPRPDTEGLTNHEKAKMLVDAAVNRMDAWWSEQAERLDSSDVDKGLFFLHRCEQPSCQHTLEEDCPPEELDESKKECELCKTGKIKSMLVLRPTGFGPCISGKSGQVIPSNFVSNRSPNINTRWPTQITPSQSIGAVVYGNINISLQRNVQLININAGAGFLAGDDDPHGFAFCKKCGHMSAQNRPLQQHHRPYAITEGDWNYTGASRLPDEQKKELRETFNDGSASKCQVTSDSISLQVGETTYNRVLLGRRFRTNAMVFRFPWDAGVLTDPDSLQGDSNNDPVRIAAKSCAAAVLQAFNRMEEITVDDSDVDVEIRRYRDGDGQGYEIFVFERMHGGIGLMEVLFEHVKHEIEAGDCPGVFEDALKTLSGKRCSSMMQDDHGTYHAVAERPCESVCSGCLVDFSTQHEAAELDRRLGHEFLLLGLGEEHGGCTPLEMPIEADCFNELKAVLDAAGLAPSLDWSTSTQGKTRGPTPADLNLRVPESLKVNGADCKKPRSPLLASAEGEFSRDHMNSNPRYVIECCKGADSDTEFEGLIEDL